MQCSGYEREWRDFLQENSNRLFQTALLLSADSHIAETALTGSIEDLDVSRAPGRNTRAVWEKAVVIRSVEELHKPSSGPGVTGQAKVIRAISVQSISVQSMLQPGLWPVVQIERSPRLCFILRMLLGYAITSCVQILGIEESRIYALLEMAAIQLNKNQLQQEPAWTARTT